MRIFATGDAERTEELKLKLAIETFPRDFKMNFDAFSNYDVIFDLNADDNSPFVPNHYAGLENKLVIVCAVKNSLTSMISSAPSALKCDLVGMNTLPTFINRSKLEVSFPNEKSRNAFSAFADEMKLEFLEVEDRVGMVTPRVICMIINEACYSLQEGVATLEDIDKAMKLGTNYPFGPFEWCDRMGVKEVYETLEAIQNDTNDERYRISELLKEKYLKEETFYPMQRSF